jgi:hypothetical protein
MTRPLGPLFVLKLRSLRGDNIHGAARSLEATSPKSRLQVHIRS